MRVWLFFVGAFVPALAMVAACSSASAPAAGAGSDAGPILLDEAGNPISTRAGSGEGGTSAGGDAGLLADGAPAPPPPPPPFTTTRENVDVNGTQRQYMLSVPLAYDKARAYPLIVALHGDGNDAAGFIGESRLETVIGQDAIVAYADHSEDLFTAYAQNTDQRLIEALVTAVKGKLTIDAAKIWGFGYSKGGYQLNEIACRKPGLLKAMAVHAGGAPQEQDDQGNVVCPNAIGLPAFITHGANDDPGGGEFAADYWASKAGCQAARQATTPPICQAYKQCPAAKPVVFCVVPNQPHYPLYSEAAAHSWAFFKSL